MYIYIYIYIYIHGNPRTISLDPAKQLRGRRFEKICSETKLNPFGHLQWTIGQSDLSVLFKQKKTIIRRESSFNL